MVTVIRSIVGAFDDDGMRLHGGGGRVVAWARRSLSEQVIGTVIRHRTARAPTSSTSGPHRVAVIETSLRARLMPRVRSPTPAPAASTATVDLSAILGLTDVEDQRAPRAANPNQNADIHVRTSTAARKEVAPPARLQAPSPGQHPRATRRLRGAALGLHLFRYRAIAYETGTRWATFRPAAA